MKAYKIELLVIDFENVGSDIPRMIEDQKYPNYCISPTVMAVQEADIGEWKDDHPLNKRDTRKEYYNLVFEQSGKNENLH